MALAGPHAYVVTGEKGLRVVDVSTPSAPVEVGFVDTPGRALSGVAVAAGFAYLGDGSGGLRVIDVSRMVEVSFLESPGAADAIAVS